MIAADPSECPFDDPSFGQDLETDGLGSLYNLQLPCPGAPHDERHLLSRIATVGKDALDEGEQSACSAQQMECSIAVLNVGGMNDNVQQETQRVDQDVPLATFDLLARVVARRIEPSPPFCVPFAVCEFSNIEQSSCGVTWPQQTYRPCCIGLLMIGKPRRYGLCTF